MTGAGDTAAYLDAFRGRSHPEEEPAWLGPRRAAAAARFGELGFPTRRQEAWRFTDLKPVQRQVFAPGFGGAAAARALIERHRLSGAGHCVVFVNGRFAPELSLLGTLPAGSWLASMRRTQSERPQLLETAIDENDTRGAQPFASLNAALFTDGLVLALDPGVVLERPVQVIHLAEGEAKSFHLRHLLLLGEGSSAVLVESFAGAGDCWTNAVVSMALRERARLVHVKVQDEAPGAIHTAVARLHLDRDSRYDGFTLTSGARLQRQDVFATLAGAGAFCGVNGAYLLRRDQEATNAVAIDHAAPGGTTREMWKGVVTDRAHGVFLGRIAVRPEAQKTDAHQLSRNLLLSPRASVDTKPELEILADDVKCSHGAAVGDLDETAVFYLRARGIAPEEARRMLIEAFAVEAIETVEAGPVRDYLAARVRDWLREEGS